MSEITCVKCSSAIKIDVMCTGHRKTLTEEHSVWECKRCGWQIDIIEDKEGRYVDVNALAGRDPAKLEGLVEAVSSLLHRIRMGNNYHDELVAAEDALAAFEGNIPPEVTE